MLRSEAMGPPRDPITRHPYNLGPMGFLGSQIRLGMQKAGYPPKTFQLYRTPDQQKHYQKLGHSNAGAFQSAHQYYAAEDIIHERYAWFEKGPDGEPFWRCLWDCVEVVAEKYQVEFDPQLNWDRAHVELKGWEAFRDVVGYKEPNQTQLDWYFQITLPKVWRAYQRQKQAQ